MSVQFLLTAAQMRRLSQHFPLSRGIPRVADWRVLSGIISVIRHRLRWRDAPAAAQDHRQPLRAHKPQGACSTASSPPSRPRAASPSA